MKTHSHFSRVTPIFVLFASAVFLAACQKGDLNALSDETVISALDLASFEISARNATPSTGPSSPIMPINMTQQFDAVGTTNNNEPVTSLVLNSIVNWSVSDQGIATINGDGLLTAHAAGDVIVTAGFGSLPSVTSSMNVSAATATTMLVSVNDDNAPGNMQINLCQPTQLKAVLPYSDGGAVTFDWDVTDQVVWKPNASADAATKITAAGQVIYAPAAALVSGSTTSIDATFAGITSAGNIVLTVLDDNARYASLLIEPAVSQLSPGSSKQLVAKTINSAGVTSDDITNFATWASSASNVISVNDSGLITGVSSSKVATNITADCGGRPTKTLTISAPAVSTLERVEITKNTSRYYTLSLSGNVNPTSRTLEAKAYYSDQDGDVVIDENSTPKKPTWSIKSLSSTAVSSIADIDANTGLVTAKNTAGTVLVTMEFDVLADDVVVVVEP